MKIITTWILVFVSLCFSVASFAGLFDKFKMALGSASIIFIEPPSVHESVKYRHLFLQKDPSKQDPLISILENKLATFRINQSVYFKQVTSTPPSRSIFKDQKWALVEISTEVNKSNDSSGTEMRTQCPGGKLTCNDSVANHYNVMCRTRTATISGKIALRDALTNEIIAADAASDSEVSEVCQDTGGNLVEAENLLGKAADEVAKKLMVKFTPSTNKQLLELIEDDSSLPDAKDKFKQAYRLASTGDVKTALQIYNQLISDGISDGIVLFNAGYCEHAQGNFKSALDLYRKASSAPNAPKDAIDKYQVTASDFVASGIDRVIPVETAPVEKAFANELNKNPTPVTEVKSPRTYETKLKALKQMYDQELISKEVYQEKQKRILDEMNEF